MYNYDSNGEIKVLKENGNRKKNKVVQCEVCRAKIDVVDDNIEIVGSTKILYCPDCGNQQILKKNKM